MNELELSPITLRQLQYEVYSTCEPFNLKGAWYGVQFHLILDCISNKNAVVRFLNDDETCCVVMTAEWFIKSSYAEISSILNILTAQKTHVL